jgi:hypothetical protein
VPGGRAAQQLLHRAPGARAAAAGGSRFLRAEKRVRLLKLSKKLIRKGDERSTGETGRNSARTPKNIFTPKAFAQFTKLRSISGVAKNCIKVVEELLRGDDIGKLLRTRVSLTTFTYLDNQRDQSTILARLISRAHMDLSEKTCENKCAAAGGRVGWIWWQKNEPSLTLPDSESSASTLRKGSCARRSGLLLFFVRMIGEPFLRRIKSENGHPRCP